jgi:predicted DNA-binding transcriptional regulator AlpA
MSADDLMTLLRQLPTGASLPVGFVLKSLEDDGDEPTPAPEPSWRERLWTCDEETRLNATEAAEALGHAVGWVYKRTHSNAEERLPHRKTGSGELVFRAGDLREWLQAREAA